jgi:cytochrome b pre-mRNA-processing protein 6
MDGGLTALQFSLTGSLMRPASNPTHYADLIKELEEAPQRGWWDRTRNKWKGFLRFS